VSSGLFAGLMDMPDPYTATAFADTTSPLGVA